MILTRCKVKGMLQASKLETVTCAQRSRTMSLAEIPPKVGGRLNENERHLLPLLYQQRGH